MVQVLDAAAHPLREVGVVNYVLQKHELLGVFCHPKDARLGKVGRLFFLLNVTLFDLFVVGAWALAAESSKKVDKALESTAGQLLLQGFLTAGALRGPRAAAVAARACHQLPRAAAAAVAPRGGALGRCLCPRRPRDARRRRRCSLNYASIRRPLPQSSPRSTWRCCGRCSTTRWPTR